MSARRAEEIFEAQGLPDSSPEEKELALAFQRGEDGAYQAIHDRYSTRVRAVCRRMLQQPDDAEEAAQESFLRIYQALMRFNGRYQLGAWITRITTNVCLDHLRARTRHPADLATWEMLEAHAPEDNGDGEPETVAIRHAEGRRVRRVLASLPPLHRAAIVLREFEGLSYAEIAIALQMTDCQVKALLHRARKGFRRTWGERVPVLLLPWRHLQKMIQRWRTDAPDQAVQAAASAAPTASACSVVLGSCGTFVAERVMPVIAAALVGTAAASGAAVSSLASSDDEPVRFASLSALDSERDGRGAPRSARSPVAASREEPAPAVAPQTPTAEEPAPAPAPEPTPEPSPDPSNQSGTATPPDPEPTPAPFQPAIGFDRHGEPAAATPNSHSKTVDCSKPYFEQRLDTTIYDGSTAYAGSLGLRATSSTGWLELLVRTPSKSYRYSSWGVEPRVTWTSGSDGNMTLEIIGEYGPVFGSNPEEVGLPTSGAFRGVVTLDCGAATVITEGVTFAGQ